MPRDQLRDLVEQLVEVEDRRDLAPELEQRDDELADVRRSGGRGGESVTGSVTRLR